jgi:hypothetical protein
MIGRLRRVTSVLLVGVLATAGCSREINGVPTGQAAPPTSTSPGDAGSATPSGGTSTSLLGEFRTIDSCSLTDPGEFSEFGTSRWGVIDSLDECLVEVVTGNPDEPVSVYVGNLDHVEAFPDIRGKKSRDVGDGLKVVDYESESSYCSQLLVFPDGLTMTVSATPYRGEEAKLCDLVTAGMNKAVKVIEDGRVNHRAYPFNSLAAIDPCVIVPGDATAAVPNLGTVSPKSYPAKHNCLWASADAVNGPRLRVMFIAGTPPKAAGEGSSETLVAGRPTVLSQSSTAGTNVYCFAEAGHVPLVNQPGLVEKVFVSVRLPKDQAGSVCKAAADVAGVLWPRLPAP